MQPGGHQPCMSPRPFDLSTKKWLRVGAFTQSAHIHFVSPVGSHSHADFYEAMNKDGLNTELSGQLFTLQTVDTPPMWPVSGRALAGRQSSVKYTVKFKGQSSFGKLIRLILIKFCCHTLAKKCTQSI